MFHITKSKSKKKPFNLVLVSIGNNEVLSSHQLATKQAAYKNAKAQIVELEGHDYVQDDTLDKPVMRLFSYDNIERIIERDCTSLEPLPKYQPGKNKKVKSK